MPASQKALEFRVKKTGARSSLKQDPGLVQLKGKVIQNAGVDTDEELLCSPARSTRSSRSKRADVENTTPVTPRSSRRRETRKSNKRTEESENCCPASEILCTPTKRSTNNADLEIQKLVESPRLKITVKKRDTSSTNCDRIPGSPRQPLTPRKCLPQVTVLSPQKSPGKRSPFTENENVTHSPSKKKKGGSVARSIFQENDQSPSIQLKRQNAQCYSQAKRALAASLPKEIVGREKEMQQIRLFIKKHMFKKSGGSLYVSGAPGTGKTAVTSQLIADLKGEKRCQVVYVNCMSFSNSRAIYNKVHSELSGWDCNLSVKEASNQLPKVFTSPGKMVVMVLDEVDQLDTKNQDVLYTMFEWPALKNSRLILIGIANALDLTDRVLPRLQALSAGPPQLLNFPPYTKDQIIQVLQNRLEKVSVEGEPVLEPSAIQFCARKVAAVAGDMRKALDICRRAVESVESDVKQQQVISAGSSVESPVPKKINIANISRVVNKVYGSGVQSTGSEQQTVPLQQKLAVCTLLLVLRDGKVKEVTIGKLHEKYCKICKAQSVGNVDQSEFLSLCQLIESRGIFSIKKSKDPRSSKVTLKLDEKELEMALQDKTLMANILQKGLQ